MQINAALNLAFPVRSSDKFDEKGSPIPLVWAYHTPISREVFEANYRVISATQIALSGKGQIGQRIASLALRDASKLDALEWGENTSMSPPLLAEIKRLTMVLSPSATGYELLPVDAAISRGVIDTEDWQEAESALVFFTCAFSMVRRAFREPVAKSYASVMRGSITSLLPMDFAASLAMSTKEETSEPTVPSSVPS